MNLLEAQTLLPEGARRLSMALHLAGWTTRLSVAERSVHLVAVGPVGYDVAADFVRSEIGPQRVPAALTRAQYRINGGTTSLRRTLLHVLEHPREP